MHEREDVKVGETWLDKTKKDPETGKKTLTHIGKARVLRNTPKYVNPVPSIPRNIGHIFKIGMAGIALGAGAGGASYFRKKSKLKKKKNALTQKMTRRK